MMSKKTIVTLVRWRQRSQPSYCCETYTIGNLFHMAYIYHYENLTSQSNARINFDMQNFQRHGRIPLYVALFAKQVLYPTFVKNGFARTYKQRVG